MECLYPGCSADVYPGGSYCSKAHRDNAQPATQTCVYLGCTRSVYPGSKFCSKNHRDNVPFTPATDYTCLPHHSTPVASNAAFVPATTGEKICLHPGCPKPVFPGSDFCSLSHRDHHSKYTASHVPSTPTTTHGFCLHPGCANPSFPGSNFCSLSHRDHHLNPVITNSSPAPSTAVQKMCLHPGCPKPVFPGSDFCSRSHRDYSERAASNAPSTPAATGGQTCQYGTCTQPVYPGSDYCNKTHRDTARLESMTSLMNLGDTNRTVPPAPLAVRQSSTGAAGLSSITPGLYVIPSTDSKYSDVENQFTLKWLHTTGNPTVHQIYRIALPSRLMTNYTNYRQQVENRGSFTLKGLTAGNERRRFHGTNRTCNVGDDGNTNICSLSNCSVCSIIKTSYRLHYSGSNKPWRGSGGGRLGDGIYTSATSSKSNDYSRNANITSPYKAMFLNKVVVGKTKKLFRDDPSLTAPPIGYDSVIGEPATATQTSTLNYDELVVYTESAIIPAYLIIYST